MTLRNGEDGNNRRDNRGEKREDENWRLTAPFTVVVRKESKKMIVNHFISKVTNEDHNTADNARDYNSHTDGRLKTTECEEREEHPKEESKPRREKE
jgi:hypothetical protein